MSYPDYVNETLGRYPSGMRVYRALLLDQIDRLKSVLHLGCGHDLNAMLSIFPPGTKVAGLDQDAEAIGKYQGDGHVGDGADMPFENAQFDLVFSEMVLEHLTDPAPVFAEVARVLKPGGQFIALTPNFWSYKSLVAFFTPHRFHQVAVRVLRRDSARQDGDVYPTVFKANTSFSLHRLAAGASLIIERLEYVDNGPTWFQRLPGVFELGRLYHFLLKLAFLAPLRCNIVIVLRKPDSNQGVE